VSAPTFPPSGDPREDSIKLKAGYVEFAVFANEAGGYFCGTCRAFCPVGEEGRQGFCRGLRVPVASYGCCNNWSIAPRADWLGADGEPL
jgi:hypothetical protein